MEAGYAGSGRAKRSDTLLALLGQSPVAEPNKIPPPKPRRDKPFRDHATHNPVGQWMSYIKLLGQRLAARDFDRQVAEVQIRAAILNGFTALGIPQTITVG